MNVSMSRCIRAFVLVCATLALASPAAADGTFEAAAALKKILGTPVFPSDIQLRPVADVYSWPLAPAFIENAMQQPGTTYLEVHVRDTRMTSAFFKIKAAQKALFSNASFVVAYGAATDLVRPISCSVQECGQQACQTLAVSSLSGVCPWNSCSTTGQCSALYEVKNCTVRMCSPFGHCIASVFQVPADRPCPPPGCYGDSDCQVLASTKTCVQKRCSGTFPTCDTYTFEIDANAPCPDDECQNDNQCDDGGEGGDGGLLGEILDAQGG